MKFVLTGSLGHIGLPLTKRLVADGHEVVVISSSEKRIPAIEKLGATAKVGNMLDEKFLTQALTGAAGAYLMTSFAHAADLGTLEQISKIVGGTYARAVKRSGVKNIVNLSSVGADQGPEVGTLHMYQNIEQMLNEVDDISLTHIRPTSMYYNLFGHIASIKQSGAIYENYSGDVFNSYVSPDDIAPVIADRLENPEFGTNVEYVASDEKTGNQLVEILGDVIGKKIEWVQISDSQKLQGLTNSGIPETLATGLTQMGAAHMLNSFYHDYKENRPILGKTKLTDFAQNEFLTAYNK